MASGRLARVRGWLADNGAERIGDAEYARMRRDLADVPEQALRKLVRETGFPLGPLVEGVKQDTPENLARTLLALAQVYESGDRETRRRCRTCVITAKDHARMASRRKPEKLPMVEWMLVWLENPPVFETWWRLRLNAQIRESTGAGENRAF